MNEAGKGKQKPEVTKRVVVLTPIAAHYRRDIYHHLFDAEKYLFTIVSGRSYKEVVSLEAPEIIPLEYRSFRIFGHPFYYLKKVIRTIRQQKPDVIISSGLDPHLLHTLCVFVLFRLIKRKAFIWWSHAGKGNQGALGSMIRSVFYRHSTGVLTYSEKGADTMVKMGVAGDRVTSIGNCVNYDDYGFMRDSGGEPVSESDSFNLLFAGRINRRLNFDVVFDSISILKSKGMDNIRFWIIGDGSLDLMNENIRDRNLEDSCILLGPLYGTDVHEYFQRADLFVFPGGIGLALVHAFSFGLPVITENRPNAHGPEIELLEEGVNGALYTPDSSKELAMTLLDWRKRSLMAKEEVAACCIKAVTQYEYLPRQVAQKIIDFLDTHAG